MSNPSEQADTTGGSSRAGTGASSRIRVEVAALTDPGTVRDRNEDAHAVFRIGRFLERVTSSLPASDLPERSEDVGHVMIVADGLGGHEAGEVASRTAIATTLEMVMRSPRWTLRLDDPATREAELRDIHDQALHYLELMQNAVRERAASDPSMTGMGTTFTGVYAVGRDLFVTHVGDSKAYVFRDGTLRKITRDHTLAQEYADLGMISQEEVATHRLHHVLTRAVGSHEQTPEADFHHLRLSLGDRLLLCSDGLTDMADESEIATVLQQHPRSEAACRALVDLALAGGGRDNITVIVAAFGDK
jgi:PPM family protein phosphatase